MISSKRSNLYISGDVITKSVFTKAEFKNEVRALNILKDETWAPRLVSYDKDEQTITMSFVSGITLKEYVALHTTFFEHMKIMILIIKALVNLHDKHKLMHLDLHIRNILVDGDDVYIIDFGNSLKKTNKTITFAYQKFIIEEVGTRNLIDLKYLLSDLEKYTAFDPAVIATVRAVLKRKKRYRSVLKALKKALKK